MTSMKADIKDLRTDVNNINAEMTDMKADINGIKDEMTGMKADINVLEARSKEHGEFLKAILHGQELMAANIEALKISTASTKSVQSLRQEIGQRFRDVAESLSG